MNWNPISLRAIFAIAVLLLASTAAADVKLPAVLNSHMVLQREVPLSIWGWADAGEQVTVTLGETTVSTQANDQGTWQVSLPAMKADGESHSIKVVGNNTIVLEDILIGDVWIGSGQSNMEWQLSQTQNANEAIAAANHPKIRLLHVPKIQSPTPADDVNAQWKICTPESVPTFSGVLYYFGLKLQKQEGVPIGLINSSWGGSPIEPWTVTNSTSGGMYNGMIAPLQPFPIRGVIWYQGETNVINKNGLAYQAKMEALIRGWRKAWDHDFPFYFVQIAPWSGRYEPGELPALWQAQAASLKTPATGMVVTTDLVDNIADIHPRNKRDVGNRLALWALAKSYGKTDMFYSGPLYKSFEIEGSAIRLNFAHAGETLTTRDGAPPNEFQIAGDDQKFVDATAMIDGKTVLVSSSQISEPAHVRFGWHKLANPNLTNSAGLPASPFQTDNWTGGTGASTPAPTAGSAAAKNDAQLFEGLGSFGRKINTDSTEAQKFFDQGMTWMYAFNHDEAIRCFLKVAEQDPDCAMAWWGVSYCEGPNYNDPITDERSRAAWYALQNALARISHASEVERDLIEALASRYANPWPQDRSQLEQAFADRMAEVWEKHPNDADVGTLYAESMMVMKPWMLYSLEGEPVEGTDRIASVLQRVLQLAPNHPGANHFYIHAIEPSTDPGQALDSAKALNDLIPASGHLLHMPSHIYVQVGMWNQAIIQNHKAMKSDAAYVERSPNQKAQHLYMVHNAHMLAFAAMMSGREKEAMAAARAMWANVPDAVLPQIGPVFDRWMSSVYDVQKRFGRWDEILAEPAPPEFLPITVAIWRAHRAIAYAAKKDFANAEKEHTEYRKARSSIPPDLITDGNLADRFLEVSDLFVQGEIALQKELWPLAIELLSEAARIEATLTYGEPPQWLQPIRHTLGAVYLKANQFEDAERVYREDLKKWPDNGWSLFGLSRALELQGKTRQAEQARQAYEQAWSRADAPIATSCQCIPKT